MKRCAGAFLLWLAVATLHAQDANSLSQYFEGKQVTVKIDMPGSQQGIDIYPQKPNPLDAKAYGKRMKSFPVALRTGDTVMVTTVKVKDKLIEFQLGGGGFGTFGDDTDTSVKFTPDSKSDREKDLETQIANTDDSDTKDRLQRELDYLRRQRERDDQRNKAIAQDAAAAKKEQVTEDRIKGGSRFNLKYDGKIPANITPQDLVAALSPYLSFPAGMTGEAAQPAQAAAGAPPAPAPASGTIDAAHSLQKGMHQEQVRALLGTPTNVADTDHDGIQLHTETFAEGNSLVHAEFVNGVLVRYSIDVR